MTRPSTTTRPARQAVPDLTISTGTAGGTVVGDGTWLTIGEVLARLRAEGYTESESTVRRMIDDGAVQSYRTEKGGHRRISSASVDRLIDERKKRTSSSHADSIDTQQS